MNSKERANFIFFQEKVNCYLLIISQPTNKLVIVVDTWQLPDNTIAPVPKHGNTSINHDRFWVVGGFSE